MRKRISAKGAAVNRIANFLALVVAVVMIGACARKTSSSPPPPLQSSSAANDRTWQWQHDGPKTFDYKNNAAPPPSTTAPSQAKLDQVLDDVAATAQERAAAQAAMDRAAADWRAWYLSHRQAAHDVEAKIDKARADQDQDALRAIRRESAEINRTMPRSNDTWKQITQDLDADQRQKLASLHLTASGDISKRLHSSLRDAPEYRAAEGKMACLPCHLPAAGG